MAFVLAIPPAVEAILWALGIVATGKVASDAAVTAMSNAQQKADRKFKSAADVQACSTCPPPLCEDNARARKQLRDEVKKRAGELREINTIFSTITTIDGKGILLQASDHGSDMLINFR